MNSGNRHLWLAFAGLSCFVSGVCLHSDVWAADMTMMGTAMTPASTAPVVIDARQALPLFPANGWRDGFFVEHSFVGDFGLHIRATGIYGKDPLGKPADGDMAAIDNRFTLHAAALLSLAGWAEVGVAMPFVLYQDSSGFNLTTAAIGDLRVLGKINFHLPDKAPQIALSVGIGFQTATANSALGAGTISGYPRLIVDMPRLFDKRLHIAANLGAVLAGTKRPCTQAELDELAKANMASMTNTTPGTGMNMDMTTTTPDCEQRQLGLGNHILWGIGVSGLISVDQGFYVTSELIGSFTVGTEQSTQSPLFWTIGLRRAKANTTYFSAAYGLGLNDASPSHTVIVGLGLVWETTPPAKKKDVPTVKVDISVAGLPSGATVTTTGKEGAKTETIPGPPPKPGKPDKADKGDDLPKPPKMEPFSIATDVEVPDGLVPDEAKKSDAGAKGGGGGKGKE